MSIQQVDKVWSYQFSPQQQSVMLVLADCAHDDGTSIRPPISYVAWQTGYSHRSIQGTIASLKKQGILVVAKKSGWRTPTEYRINWSKATPKKPFSAIAGEEG